MYMKQLQSIRTAIDEDKSNLFHITHTTPPTCVLDCLEKIEEMLFYKYIYIKLTQSDKISLRLTKLFNLTQKELDEIIYESMNIEVNL